MSGSPISFAVEDIPLAIIDDELVLHVSETNDRMHEIISEQIDSETDVDGFVGDLTQENILILYLALIMRVVTYQVFLFVTV